MSSLHVVRENQGPALVIADMQAVPFVFIQQVLEWSPLGIVPEAALLKVQAWGIKFDALICRQEM